MSSTSTQPHSSRPHRRYKTIIACVTCRRRKVKCDGLRPVCGRCQNKRELQETCSYIAASVRRSSTVNHHHSSAAVSSQLPTPATSAQVNSEESNAIRYPSAYSPGNPGEFSFEVKAAIDTRLGLPSPKRRCPIPLTDAPLFGLLSIPDITDAIRNPTDHVLPSCRHADHLVSLYWQCLDPLEPLLDQKSFWTSYQALFDGTEIECNRQIFLCMLNLVFALSTQLQEPNPPEQRHSASRTFFLRAWHLLRPEIILWQAGSLETVQSLLLMTRYLQCTPNLQQTWMALGSAVRIALSIGLDRSARNVSGSQRGHEVALDIWQQCVFMDRCLSWSLGRPSSAPRVPFSFNSLRNGGNPPNCDNEAVISVSEKMQELTKITGYIGVSQVNPSSSSAEGLGLAMQTQPEPYTVIQIDERLTGLENSLPPVPFNSPKVESADRQLLLLRLRISYTRIMLLRPTMANFCLSHLQTQKPGEPSLGDHFNQTSATLCVTNAQKLITLIQASCSHQDKTGLIIIPWWYRIFFLYIAMQHLITAMLRPDIFATVVQQSWNTAVSILSAHEHLSLSVGKCLNSFRLMWQKVGDIHRAPMTQEEVLPPHDADCDMGLRDVFRHLGFDEEIPLFGLDDSEWLGNVDWV
ncbi:putative fungal-specific transcription factor domain protein [Aspergillus tamarii]|uniref:Putative fungal-specific transcription factor domain protein n=1 Tax=Aspergillus tamarii TaxID=41984 RepID=A0A5N6UUJ7_ASPTM|nr:putative fungal-specific transcription factor domain protein [Aspergillus tamarii]